MRKFVIFISFLLVVTVVQAKEQRQGLNAPRLSEQDIEQLKEAKALLNDVDRKSLAQTIIEMEKTKYPQVNVQMRQAMARAYADIVKEHKIEGQKKREWLYSMINLNMAYLQFGGSQDPAGQSKSLNKLILRKLKEHLPSEMLNHPGFRCALG